MMIDDITKKNTNKLSFNIMKILSYKIKMLFEYNLSYNTKRIEKLYIKGYQCGYNL